MSVDDRRFSGAPCPGTERLHTMALVAERPPPEHVADCPACRDRWDGAVALVRLLESEATELFPDACPDATAWAVATERGLDAGLEAHLDDCGECRALWGYLTATGRSGTLGVRGLGRLRSWAAAASLLVGLLLWARPWSPIRSASEMIIRGSSVVLDGSSRRLPDGDALLQWTPLADAEAYRVRLWEADGLLITQELLPGSRHRFRVAASSMGDGALLWQVEALASGQAIGGTRVQRLAAPEEERPEGPQR